MSRVLIVGGSDAGISAALRIRELDARVDVTVLLADAYPGYSICGLPFFLSGEVADWRALAHHTTEDLERKGVRLLLEHRAEELDVERKVVRVASADGRVRDVPYDRLLIATGAQSTRPRIEGLDRAGVFFLRWMSDGLAMRRFIEQENPRRAVIVGGGYIGLELADALTRRGLQVTLLEYAPEILTTFDAALGHLVRMELESRGVEVATGQAVQSLQRDAGALRVQTASGESWQAEMVLVVVGVTPDSRLARTAGIATSAAGAIQVDRTMATGIPGIWAAGDCAATWHHILEADVYMPLGTTAHKQGRVAGENMVGGKCEFNGTLGTQAVKVFDLVAAGTGLRDSQAVKAGYHPLTTSVTVPDHNPYYAGSADITVAVTGDTETGRLLGAQLVGRHSAEVSKRVDVVAAALFAGLRVESLCDMDLSYTPPLSTPWDPVQKAAVQWCSLCPKPDRAP